MAEMTEAVTDIQCIGHIGRMLKERQETSGLSPEKYANRIGLTTNSFYKLTRSYETSPRYLTTIITSRLGRYYSQAGDYEIVAALAELALGGPVAVQVAKE
jgi:hypothetical protein